MQIQNCCILNSKYKIINMQKSNTLFYHGHIISNIDTLDKRKDGYLNLRLEFLNQHCIPIQKKIDQIKDSIKFYENMRDTQYEVIEAEPDIMQLKKQISDFKLTNQYFQHKLDEFDRSIAHMEINLQNRGKLREERRQQCRVLFNLNGGRLNLTNKSPRTMQNNKSQYSLAHKGSIKTYQSQKVQQRSRSKSKSRQRYREKKSTIVQSSNYLSQTTSRQKLDRSIVHSQTRQKNQSSKLPRIQFRKAYQNYYSFIQEKQIQRHERNKGRIEKMIQKQNQVQNSLNESSIFNPQVQKVQLNQTTIKQIKQIITQFDYTESLFRQCMERKKLSIQKSVSQLQSKLISNKQLFLSACQVIGEKQGKFSFQDFCQLSTDELITLFISFSWLGRKIYNQFSQKRKDLMGILHAIKSIQDQK